MIMELMVKREFALILTNLKPLFFTAGDDTLHTPIPYYPAPAFVGSDLPKDEDDSRLVDIYYLDFFDHQLKGVLANLTGQSWTSNTTISPYTTNTVWTQYVKNYWKECPENTLFY